MQEKKNSENYLVLIKPDAILEPKKTQIIMTLIFGYGFEIAQVKRKKLTPDDVDSLYAEHVDRHYYPPHKEFMLSAYCDIFHVRPRVVRDGEEMQVSDGGILALKEAVRYLFADVDIKYRNAIHTSDSIESGIREVNLFFPGTLSSELLECKDAQ